jgi:hypothetical protein
MRRSTKIARYRILGAGDKFLVQRKRKVKGSRWETIAERDNLPAAHEFMARQP